MSGLIKRSLGLVLFVCVVSLVVGSALGQPILLSYVETDSMQPTLNPGDGFLAVPNTIAGPVKEGDIVVYRAEELHGGDLTTHRVMGKTDRGYITKGDANAFTDQDRKNEPPVKDAQIVAQAFQVGEHVVVIPHLGDAVSAIGDAIRAVQRTVAKLFGTDVFLGAQGLAYLLFAGSILYYVVSEIRRRNTRNRETNPRRTKETGLDVRLVVGAFTLMLVAGATAPMVIPAGTQKYDVVSADFDSDRPTVVPKGETRSLKRSLTNSGTIPVVVYLNPVSEGVDVQPRRAKIGGGDRINATVTLQAPPEIGYYRRYITEHRYLAILPAPLIDALYRIHPWAPIVVTDALIGIPFYFVGVRALGTGRIGKRSRSRDPPALVRVRRAFRSLY
jgi:signal peptidase